MISVNELRAGIVFEEQGPSGGGKQFFLVLAYEHIKTGRGSGNIKVKVRNLENGLTVKVPLFIKNGEVIRVDTRDGSYVERAK